MTIGNLASELVFRVTGRTLHEFYEQELRHPLEHRLLPRAARASMRSASCRSCR